MYKKFFYLSKNITTFFVHFSNDLFHVSFYVSRDFDSSSALFISYIKNLIWCYFAIFVKSINTKISMNMNWYDVDYRRRRVPRFVLIHIIQGLVLPFILIALIRRAKQMTVSNDPTVDVVALTAEWATLKITLYQFTSK